MEGKVEHASEGRVEVRVEVGPDDDSGTSTAPYDQPPSASPNKRRLARNSRLLRAAVRDSLGGKLSSAKPPLQASPGTRAHRLPAFELDNELSHGDQLKHVVRSLSSGALGASAFHRNFSSTWKSLIELKELEQTRAREREEEAKRAAALKATPVPKALPPVPTPTKIAFAEAAKVETPSFRQRSGLAARLRRQNSLGSISPPNLLRRRSSAAVVSPESMLSRKNLLASSAEGRPGLARSTSLSGETLRSVLAMASRVTAFAEAEEAGSGRRGDGATAAVVDNGTLLWGMPAEAVLSRLGLARAEGARVDQAPRAHVCGEARQGPRALSPTRLRAGGEMPSLGRVGSAARLRTYSIDVVLPEPEPEVELRAIATSRLESPSLGRAASAASMWSPKEVAAGNLQRATPTSAELSPSAAIARSLSLSTLRVGTPSPRRPRPADGARGLSKLLPSVRPILGGASPPSESKAGTIRELAVSGSPPTRTHYYAVASRGVS